MASKPPVKQIRMGKIKAIVWENDTQNGTRFSVTIVRLYKEGDEWRETTSFDRDDLLLVAKVADKCHDFIYDQIADSQSQDIA